MIFLLALAAAVAPAPDPASIQSLYEVGQCIATRSPQTAREVLAMDFRSSEYQRMLKAIGRGSGPCMAPGTDFRSSGVLFAGAIAEGLLKTEFKQADLAADFAFDPARAPIEARNDSEEMALCMVMRAPAQTAHLLQTAPASREEADAEDVLAPLLSDCLKKGAKLELNRPGMRSLLALAAYRIVTSPKGAAQ